MKTRLIHAFFLLLLFQYAGATVRTVSNYYNTPGQYTTLTAAVAAASSGDTIYVHPSNTVYDAGDVTITINKQLTIFGAGWDGRSYQFSNLNVTIYNIVLTKNGSLSTASGTHLSGLQIEYMSVSTDTIFNVLIERCYINTSFQTSASGNLVASSNWIVRDCFLPGGVNATSRNNMFSNNFLTTCSSEGTNVFTNNVFLDSYTAYTLPLGTVVNSIFSNNIFDNYNSTAQAIINTNITGNTFDNNLTYNFNNALPGTNNTGANNLNGDSPGFTNPYATWITTFDSLANYNWQLTASSVGHNAGTDTTDIGAYGGAYPIANLQGVTQLPQIILMNISNPSIPVGGNVNVTVTGIKRN